MMHSLYQTVTTLLGAQAVGLLWLAYKNSKPLLRAATPFLVANTAVALIYTCLILWAETHPTIH